MINERNVETDDEEICRLARAVGMHAGFQLGNGLDNKTLYVVVGDTAAVDVTYEIRELIRLVKSEHVAELASLRSEVLTALAEAHLAAVAKPVEWQARPTGAQEWRRIDPTREHPTVEMRADYLRAFKNADGSNAYAVRALYTAPRPNGQ